MELKLIESNNSEKLSKIGIISRSEIPSISEIEINGEIHNLGILKDFRRHPSLASFLPDQARLSISWVSLKPDEVLKPHEHPTASMIIVCEGEGELLGDLNQPINIGDIVAIPPFNKHGFIGGTKAGFWGLSIQFEGLGLYENREAPRVHFIGDTPAQAPSHIDALLQDQQFYENNYKVSPLLKLLKSDNINDPMVKERLLEALNFWGNWFQRILFVRAAIRGKSSFQEVAEDHIKEERGHNKNLLIARGNKPIQLWDPVLDGAAAWFYEQMFCATDEERTVLIHFVLEASGDIFHSEAVNIFSDIDHFRQHSAVEEEHFKIGCRLLENTPGIDFNLLRDILYRGWTMMSVLCERIADIGLNGAQLKSREELLEPAEKAA